MSTTTVDTMSPVDDEVTVEIPEEQQGPSPEDLQVVEDAAQKLKDNCHELRFKISWIPGSKQADRSHKEEMTLRVGASTTSVGVTKKLFQSKLAEVKAANEAKMAVYAHFHSNSIPLAAVKPEAVDETDRAKLKKSPGSRVVKNCDIAEFDVQQSLLIANMYNKITDMQGILEDIKAEDKEKLGKLYNPEDYPENVRDCVLVYKSYHSLDISIDLRALAPDVYHREMKKLVTVCGDTAQLATNSIAEAILNAGKVMMKQLGNRTRLNPPTGSENDYLQDAEIVEYLDHSSDPEEVEEGEIHLQVRYQEPGKSRKDTKWLDPMTTEEYSALRPYTTDEPKKVHTSSLELLMDHFQWFRNMADTLVDGAAMHDAIKKFNEMLASAGSNNKQIIGEMRNSTHFRNFAREGLGEMVGAFQDVITGVKKRRRRITMRTATDIE